MKKIATILASLAFLSVAFPCVSLAQQQQKTPEQMEKEYREALEKQVERLSETLELSAGQEFWMDSILTHNGDAMRDEIQELSKKKVTNSELYYSIHDKWSERTYQAIKKILDPEQWEKYLKTGAAREKKARDKRMSKRKN